MAIEEFFVLQKCLLETNKVREIYRARIAELEVHVLISVSLLLYHIQDLECGMKNRMKERMGVDRWIDRWVGWMDGWMDRWMDGWVEGGGGVMGGATGGKIIR